MLVVRELISDAPEAAQAIGRRTLQLAELIPAAVRRATYQLRAEAAEFVPSIFLDLGVDFCAGEPAVDGYLVLQSAGCPSAASAVVRDGAGVPRGAPLP